MMRRRFAVPLAFGLVYVLWGSTYLAIRYAIQTIPPFFMAGTRFFVAGAILYVWSRARGAPKPTTTQWRNSAIAGTLLLMFGNGFVTWAEQRVPSGITAVLVATVPLWMVVLGWLTSADGASARPTPRAWVGVALGLIGVAVLVRPTADNTVDLGGAVALLIASICWSYGSLFGRRADLPKSPLLTTGMEMLTGGTVLFAAGLLTGESAHFAPSAVSPASLLALLYLITLGSIVGYSAYTYLVTAVTPAKLGTYAYVNPVIAVILGATIAGEPIGPMTVVAIAIIIGAVLLLSLKPRPTPTVARSLAADS
ncbi:MAG TPA: drug/metabolite exporter YedA [Gemmatimonadaceae bacterium]|jgi:drug/metabolite transporter (DMT)-like permease|nr:drug/metabolite exporter YedA [Gemmatimonadaceae bacterium]